MQHAVQGGHDTGACAAAAALSPAPRPLAFLLAPSPPLSLWSGVDKDFFSFEEGEDHVKGRGKKRRVHEGMGRHGAWRRREKKEGSERREREEAK